MNESNKEKIEKLNEMIKESKDIVFFGGAGVSTESGIKDFRSKDGIYSMKYKYDPEYILSHDFFINHTDEFFEFYKDKLNVDGIKPNIVHKMLTKLEQDGKLKAIITQNIDGLHQSAGSKNVLELHGSVKRNYCMKCNKFYDDNYVFNSKGVPKCSCKGIIKPDVVLYGEGLDNVILNKAINAISNADMLIIGGTSLLVNPAAMLVNYFRGKFLVLINNDPTPYDSLCDLVIYEKLGKVFENIKYE